MMDDCGDAGEAIGLNNVLTWMDVFEDMDGKGDGGFKDPKNVGSLRQCNTTLMTATSCYMQP
jgi:hypothetical protein